MQVSVTFNFDNIRKKNLYLSDKYKSTWSDPDNPTNEVLSKDIKEEIYEE